MIYIVHKVIYSKRIYDAILVYLFIVDLWIVYNYWIHFLGKQKCYKEDILQTFSNLLPFDQSQYISLLSYIYIMWLKDM